MSALHRFAVTLVLGLGLMVQAGAWVIGDGVGSINGSLFGLSLVLLASVSMVLARLKR